MFFHRMASQHRKIKNVAQLEDKDGRIKTGNEEIAQITCRYFIDLFTSRGKGDSTRLLTGIPVHVTNGMNEFLSSRFIEEEFGVTCRICISRRHRGWMVCRLCSSNNFGTLLA